MRDAATIPDVSVVVATRDRAARLERLLAGLAAQTIGGDRFEVIVVDDGSADRTPALLAAAAERGELPLRTLRHDRPAGRAAAREDGWRAARGDLVAFIDDDCVPAPDWLAAGVEASASETIVQGR